MAKSTPEPTYTDAIVAWDRYVKLELWNGKIRSDHPVIDTDGVIFFIRADGKPFFINARASRFQYIQVVEGDR